MPPTPRRCVLLFSASQSHEAAAKGLPKARTLFLWIRRRLAGACTEAGVDLLLCGAGEAPAGARAIAQRGRGFADRLGNALADARALGYGEIVVVPADVPGIGARHLERAFALLAEHAVVLGPSPDGGVYLLGCRGEARALLRDVRWRTSSVCAALLRNAGDAALLEPLRDVDRWSDLTTLRSAPGLDPELSQLLALLLPPLRLPCPYVEGPPSQPPCRGSSEPRAPPERRAA